MVKLNMVFLTTDEGRIVECSCLWSNCTNFGETGLDCSQRTQNARRVAGTLCGVVCHTCITARDQQASRLELIDLLLIFIYVRLLVRDVYVCMSCMYLGMLYACENDFDLSTWLISWTGLWGAGS